MRFYRWTRRTRLCMSSAGSPPQPFCTAKRSVSVCDYTKCLIIHFRVIRRLILLFLALSLSSSLAAVWWVPWWCCIACSSSIVSPKQRSQSITWPWLTSLFPARVWIKQHGLVCVHLFHYSHSIHYVYMYTCVEKVIVVSPSHCNEFLRHTILIKGISISHYPILLESIFT